MTENEQLGNAGASGSMQGPYELTPEHMVGTNGVIRPELVPPPDAEICLPQIRR